MALSLIRKLFSRNRSRERRIDINRTPDKLKTILNIAVIIFFTPAVVITSMFTHSMLLAIADIAVSVGFIADFIYSVSTRQVTPLAGILTVLGAAGAIAAGLLLIPYSPLSAGLLLYGLSMANSIAAGLNIFGLTRKIVLPVLSEIASTVLHFFGCRVSSDVMVRAPLTVERDKSVLTHLFRERHGLRSGRIENSPHFTENLRRYNNLQNLYANYINRYHKKFLGSLRMESEINTLSDALDDLTIRGKASYGFIRRKISFKKVKVEDLKVARDALADTKRAYEKKAVIKRYCKLGISAYFRRPFSSKGCETLKREALNLFDQEITRQEQKIKQLEDCLPYSPAA